MQQLVNSLPKEAVHLSDLDLYACPDGKFFRRVYRAVTPNTFYNLQLSKAGTIAVTIGSQRKKFTAARLVARAFLPNPNNLPVVQHIDGDVTNNAVTNLRWVRHVDVTLSNSRVSKTLARYGGRLTKSVDGKAVNDEETRAARREYYKSHKEIYARANKKYRAVRKLRKAGVVK